MPSKIVSHTSESKLRNIDENASTDEIPEDPYPFRSVVFFVISVSFYLFDLGADLQLDVRYYLEGHFRYFLLTLTFTLVPNLTMESFHLGRTTEGSLKWYMDDKEYFQGTSRLRWTLRYVMLLLQLGPVLRYIDTWNYGRKCKLENDKAKKLQLYERMRNEDADATLLSLFEAFMEAAPQLLLQLYILNHPMTNENKFTEISRNVTCFTSFLTISWALTSQQRSMRTSQRYTQSLAWRAVVVHYLWVLPVTTSRILVLHLFSSLFPYALITACVVRFIIWFCWLISLKTEVFKSRFDAILYKAALGIVFTFVFVNPTNDPTKWRYIVYYLYTIIENTALIAVWHSFSSTLWYSDLAVIGIYVLFFLGISFMILYYDKYQPTVSRRFKKPKEQSDESVHAGNGNLNQGQLIQATSQ